MRIRHCVKIIFLLLILYNPLQAQIYTSYSSDGNRLLSNMKAGIESKFIADSIAATGENKKYLRKQFRGRRDFLIGLFENDMIVSSKGANDYLNKLVDEIITNNPFLRTCKPRPMLSKAWWPNAFSAGEGTIMFNLGLFNKVANESQLAFIICHELSHLYLDHSNKDIHEYVNTVYARDFQKELKSIKKSSYQQNKKLDELEKSITYSGRRHGRMHEAEADSMAVVLLSKTRFDVRESLTALDLLGDIDSSVFDMEAMIRTSFHFPEYPFKETWLKKEKGFFGELKVDYTIPDTLKTHPDCSKRIILLKPLVENLKNDGQLFPISQSSFTSQQDSLDFVMIETLISFNEVSKVLYYTLVLQSQKPNDPYLIATTVQCLNKIYSNQKQHTLGKITDSPSPYYPKDYNTLLKFFEPLRLDEVAAVAHYYALHNRVAAKGNTVFEKALLESTINFNQTLINK